MKSKTLFAVIVGILVIIYLNTALVFGGTTLLVFKPFHGIHPFYGGGEEGSWRRDHPNEPEPWWLKGEFIRLGDFEDEASQSVRLTIYGIGYYATVIAFVGLVSYHIVRGVFPRTRKS